MTEPYDLHLEQFRAYDFAADQSYQDGLQAMISTGALDGKTDDEKENWFLATRVFYFNRVTGSKVAVGEVLSIEEATNTTLVAAQSPTSTQEPASALDTNSEPRTLSFAELKELIEQGKTDQIPNNRIIPDELSKDAPSESKATVRKKPWEA
ncbi:hypothetical protein BC835DRAFT_1030956 [Cytidiella melzeri]|nr:hypothetical protein BC835DRAFT_1030956 [Cytidiella melzeri]